MNIPAPKLVFASILLRSPMAFFVRTNRAMSIANAIRVITAAKKETREAILGCGALRQGCRDVIKCIQKKRQMGRKGEKKGEEGDPSGLGKKSEEKK